MATALQLFDKILLRMRCKPPEHDYLTVVDMVLRAIDRRLLELGSDLIKTERSEALAADANEITLPTGMLAIANNPKILYNSGNSCRELTPLPESKRFCYYTDTGTPEHYEIRGTKLRVYPTADADATLKFETFDRQTVDSMNSTIPYNGLFDDVIIELLVRYGVDPAIASVDPALDLMVRKGIDQVLGRRSPKNIRWKMII